MIVVHHLNDSRSQRILWLLEELRCEYTVKRYQRDPKTLLAPPGLREVHPLGKSPVIVDGGVTVAESGAIVEYLGDHYDTENRLIPVHGTPARRRCNYWLHYAEGSAMPPLLLKLVFGEVQKAPAPFFVRPVVNRIVDKVNAAFIKPQLELHMDYMESELDKHDWFGGETFGVADIQMSFPIEAAAARAGLDASRPNLWRYLERIHARPAYRRALERGGEYAYARGAKPPRGPQ